MKKLCIVGAGGFAREVAWLVEEINESKKEWELIGFIDDNQANIGKELNSYKILGTTDYLNTNLSEEVYVVVAIGNGKTREKIINKLKNKKYATLIHPNVKISNTNLIKEGTIICSGNILTVNIEIGKHVIVNLDCTIGHDSVIEDYVTVLPSVNLSGNTITKKYSTIGTGTKVIQGITIEENVIVGAGTVVIRDIESDCTAVGNPARIIKK